MLDRIERVTRTSMDAGRSFKRKEGYEDRKEQKQQFSQMLDKEMDKKEQDKGGESRPQNYAGPHAPNAYALDLARPTHSLYYENEVDLAPVRKRVLKQYDG